MHTAKKLTADEIVNLESIFWVLIRNIRKNEKITISETIKQFNAILNNNYQASFHDEFNKLNDFCSAPKFGSDDKNISDTLLERKNFIHEKLSGEAASLQMQQTESYRLNRRSASFSSSIISAITRKEVKIYWVYVEFDAINFINALLDNNEKHAYDCIFKQQISSDTKCYLSCEDASRIMSSNERYLTGLYLDCLIPLRISIEVSTNYIHAKEASAPTIKQLDSEIKIMSCFVGNKNFKDEHCNHANTKDRKIAQCSAKFIATYQRLLSSEILYEKESRIITTKEKENGCSLS